MLIVAALCAAVVIGTTVIDWSGNRQNTQAQIALRQLDARIAESEAAEAEAENLPRAIAAEWAGQTEYLETRANLDRDRATTDALIALALADLHREQQWRGYTQAMFALVLCSLIGGGGLYLVYHATR